MHVPQCAICPTLADLDVNWSTLDDLDDDWLMLTLPDDDWLMLEEKAGIPFSSQYDVICDCNLCITASF